MGARFAVMVGVLVVTTAGCATQADIQELRREQRRLSGRMADTRVGLEAMQRDMAKLRGRIDEERHARGAPGGNDRIRELEARLALMEDGEQLPVELGTETETDGAPMSEQPGEQTAAVPPPADQPAEAGSDAPAAEAPPGAPEEYRKGLSQVQSREYDRAIQSFRSFLRTNGESPLAPNAHYWIGDSYFMLGDYYQAILNFNDVRQRYASSDRAPAAVLKIGLAFQKMGNKTEARLAFQKVVQDYPASPEATKAKEQLQALRS